MALCQQVVRENPFLLSLGLTRNLSLLVSSEFVLAGVLPAHGKLKVCKIHVRHKMYPTFQSINQNFNLHKINGTDGAEFNTPDKLEYKFGPVASGSLEFEYRGPHNCHVCLTPGPAEIDPMYEVILGGWENTQSVIRHCRQKPDKVVSCCFDVVGIQALGYHNKRF